MATRTSIVSMLSVLLCLIVALVAGCYAATGGTSYRLKRVTVQVLDYDTEKPVAGAVVSVRWYATDLLCIHGSCICGEAVISEVRTRSDGIAVVLPPWTRRRGWSVAGITEAVFVHKAGYVVAAETEPFGRAFSRKFFLLPPGNFAHGPERLASALDALDRDVDLPHEVRPSRFPLLQREVAKTMDAVPADVREKVREIQARTNN